VDPPAVARGPEFADRPAFAVRPLDREDVLVVRETAVAAGDFGGGARRCRGNGQEDQGEEGLALQWCSITRSTMLYAFASSALMK